MLNICSESIYKPLVIIFRQAPPTDMFSRKNSSLTQKSDKQNVKNHRSISVLPICSQIFQRLIFKSLIVLFCQPVGFQTWDSCINQVLLITHEIYKSFDDGIQFSNSRKMIFLVIFCIFYMIIYYTFYTVF